MKLDVFDKKNIIIMKGKKTLIIEEFGEGCQISAKGGYVLNIVTANSKTKTNQLQIC